MHTAPWVELPDDPAAGVRALIENARNSNGTERIAVIRRELQESMDRNAQVFRTE